MLKILIITLIPVLAACQLKPLKQPAVLNQPSSVEVDKIASVIGLALDSDSIQLNEKIFSQSNELIIERAPIKTNPYLLSIDDRPNHFLLLKGNSSCFIYHRQSEREWHLNDVKCTPLTAISAEDKK